MSATIFKQVNYDLSSLINYIELGEIGLPDIQRPFIWKNTKVRDLFDSMYRGYPVGYLLFWQNAFVDGAKAIGTEDKQKSSRLLIVDGQQRLTSLYAVLKGAPVVRANYQKESIEIAFDPLLEKFEVADAAIRRDKAYIPNISKLWSKDTDIFEVVDEYLDALGQTRELTSEETKGVKKAISGLHSLLSFPFTALELSSNITEEQVAEIFVRVNSKGISLNQADFILTLMSVFWDEGRADLESFCRRSRAPETGPSPFNHYIDPDPDQLLRVGVGLGFKRARLNHVYSILRGKDLDSGEFSDERRDQQFGVLQEAQSKVLNLQYWHDFFKAIRRAGFRSRRMISSENNLLYAYVFYLIGRTQYGVEENDLRRVTARWFFMSALTGRFTSSPESTMEFDLARLREVNDADGFVHTLDRVWDQTLTSDFWSITLPNDLATSSATSPSQYAFYAALVLLDARVLFSDQKVAELLSPETRAQRSAIERHHLFPRGYLKTLGVSSIRDTNQIANFALVEWGDNAEIGDQAPPDYAPDYKAKFSASDLERMYYWHALPEDWEKMRYNDFLVRRRELMSQVIGAAAELLKPGVRPEAEPPSPSLEEIVLNGETTEVEFKSTLRINMHTGQPDPRIELSCLKTIAGFLNTRGGKLIVGVADDGSPVGIREDSFPNEDKMSLYLVNLVNGRIGSEYMMYVHPRFEDYQGKRVMAVECWPSKSPIYVKEGPVEHFYIRAGTSTSELTASQSHAFINQHFGK